MTELRSDDQFLLRALELARRGIGLASPSPCVGAVIVDSENRIVGEGSYTYSGLKHAEVIALAQAGEKARGATLYINLEPHAHHGRTPPCTDALVAAGIRRVVASMPDPNPKVSGLGFEKLRAAGVQVEVAQIATEARQLNEAFARYIRHGIPLITLKSAMTLDGKIAPHLPEQNDQSTGVPAGGWITGEAARANVQQQRHQSDALLVGIGTILADDPLLTDRSGKERRRPLVRVILDSHLRLPVDSRIVKSVIDSSGTGDVLVFYCNADSGKTNDLEARGVKVEELPPDEDGRPALAAVLRRLGELELTSLLIEGGSHINGAALRSGIVDKLYFYYAPRIFGTLKSIPFASAKSSQELRETLRPRHLRLHRFGEDFAIESYLRDPYGD